MTTHSKTVLILMVVLAGIAVLAPAVRADEQAAVTMEELLASSDVVLTQEAMSGAPVAIVAHPEQAEGGKFLQSNFLLTLKAIVQAWKQNPRAGLESLLRDILARPTGTTGGTLITNAEFTTDLTGWTFVNAYGGATDFGPNVAAPTGSADGRFAVAHTGTWDAAVQGSMEQTINVTTPKNMVFTVGYNFITTEWPQTGGQFNDNATVTVSDVSGNTVQFALFESLNSSTFTQVDGLPTVINGGRGQTGGATGWLTNSSQSIFFANGSYKIRIEVNDVSDPCIDSAILVDMVSLQ